MCNRKYALILVLTRGGVLRDNRRRGFRVQDQARGCHQLGRFADEELGLLQGGGGLLVLPPHLGQTADAMRYQDARDPVQKSSNPVQKSSNDPRPKV